MVITFNDDVFFMFIRSPIVIVYTYFMLKQQWDNSWTIYFFTEVQ